MPEMLIIGLFGVIIGSFLNVIIHRLPIMIIDGPENYNLAYPNSSCPNCGASINPLDNIPIISFICLGGKCRKCKNKISCVYPIVELLSLALSLFAYTKYGISWKTAEMLIIGWILISITIIDIKHFLIPDVLNYILLWTALLSSAYEIAFVNNFSAINGAFLGYISLWSLYWLVRLSCKKEAMGYGDFKLNAAIGAWIGAKILIVHIFIAFTIGAIIGISLLLLNRHKKDSMIPFGPFLAISGFISINFGESLLNYYLSLLR